ncbi:DUF551 domain-containing protein [Histophilus somni]|uniref:DUF551 domain-containing protein n=1 Tax=Histophilus somni TaxID=731 RepID=UPI00003976B4|nr:DUF551 domain-containing protein [Histophilus somni]ACA32537.1 conserved hypothetical protein [Histophilus somni 2336]
MNNKKYFSIDVSNDIHSVELHETLEQAKQSCLNSAVDAYDFANDLDEFENYEGYYLPFAVYGVILGKAISSKRPLTKEEKESGYYDEIDEIINSPEILEINGWISVKDKLPKSGERVLVYFKNASRDYKSITLSELVDGEFNMSSKLFEVTHWQPLPQPPKDVKNE